MNTIYISYYSVMNHSYWTIISIIVSVIDHSEIVKLSGHQLNSNLTSITLVYA